MHSACDDLGKCTGGPCNSLQQNMFRGHRVRFLAHIDGQILVRLLGRSRHVTSGNADCHCANHNAVLLGPQPSLSDIQPRLALREPLLALGLLGLLLPELGLLCVMRLVCAVDNVTGR